MNLIDRLLIKNVSRSQLAGFLLSNLVGLAIVISGLQFYVDVRSLWNDEDSFIRKDYLVVNRRVTASDALSGDVSSFSDADVAELERQPWVRKVGRFENVGYKVSASMGTAGRSMSTGLFFESIPSEFIDVASDDWDYEPGSVEVPIILPRDYLTLYNFGFSASAGMPRLTEQMIGSVPLALTLSGPADSSSLRMRGRIVGFSDRLNTILVPQEFMEWSNARFGAGKSRPVSRLIIDVSSPGDAAIASYLDAHGMEAAGDGHGSQASYFLNLVSGVVVGVGMLITLLSFFILMLSVALLMQKNRGRLHTLIQLGYPLRRVAAPYGRMTAVVGMLSYALAAGAMFVFRSMYIGGLSGMSGVEAGDVWVSLGVGLALTAAVVSFNCVAIRRKVRAAF